MFPLYGSTSQGPGQSATERLRYGHIIWRTENPNESRVISQLDYALGHARSEGSAGRQYFVWELRGGANANLRQFNIELQREESQRLGHGLWRLEFNNIQIGSGEAGTLVIDLMFHRHSNTVLHEGVFHWTFRRPRLNNLLWREEACHQHQGPANPDPHARRVIHGITIQPSTRVQPHHPLISINPLGSMAGEEWTATAIIGGTPNYIPVATTGTLQTAIGSTYATYVPPTYRGPTTWTINDAWITDSIFGSDIPNDSDSK